MQPGSRPAAAGPESARSALRRSLSGRGPALPQEGAPASGAGNRPAEGRKRDQEKVTAPALLGDHELFDVDQSAPAVIERAAERRPEKRSGPALGAEK